MTDLLTPPLLRIEGLSKAFPGTRALDAVSLGVAKGEVHALLGANGSGKSTLIKVLAGYHRADPGAQAWLGEDELDLVSPLAARHEGLRFVHQDLGIVLELDAVDNFCLHAGFRPGRSGRVRWRDAARRTRRAIERFGMDFDVRKPMAEAAPVERTVVAIAAAIDDWEADGGLLVLDEPTASLPPTEVAVLFEMVAEVRRAGASVLYVSHRLDEIFEIAQRVTVLRAGQLVGTRDVADLVPRDVITMMIGSAMDTDIRPSARTRDGATALLEARDLHGRFLHGVDLSVGPGEIVGVAGLLGSGREEIPYVLAGASEAAGASGTIRHRRPDGEPGPWAQVAAAKTRLPLVPADRGSHGVVGEMTIQENMTLPSLGTLSPRPGFLPAKAERALAREWMNRLDVQPNDPLRPIATLSGGNQQKVVVGRWLAQGCEVLVLCEPTAGVDIGARTEIYRLLVEQAEAGLGIVVSSSDTDDLLHLCTRVVVLRDGVVSRELSFDEITKTALQHAMEGTDA